MTNHEIIEAIKAGDVDKVWIFIANSRKMLRKCENVIRRVGIKEYQAIKDIIQDSIIAFIENVSNQKFSTEKKLEPYFVTICRNKAVDHIKRSSHHPSESAEYDQLNIFQDVSEVDLPNPNSDEFIRLIDKVAIKLSEACREVFRLSFVEDLKRAIIAKKLNKKVDYISKRKGICLEQFVSLFKEDPEGKGYYEDHTN